MKYITVLLITLNLIACSDQGVPVSDRSVSNQVALTDIAIAAVNSNDGSLASGINDSVMGDWIGVIVPFNSVDVVANAGGLLTVSARPGDTVSQGDVVARVDNFSADDELKIAGLQLKALEADLEQAEFNAQQEQSIYDRRIAYPDAISKDELERAASSAKAAAAQWKSAQAALDEQKIRVEQSQQGVYSQSVVAPFAGSVELSYLDSGAALTPGTAIMRISSRDTFKIRFAVEPEQAIQLDISHQVWVSMGNTQIPAEIMGVAPFVDIPSQKVFVEAFPLEQSRVLRSGLSVTVSSAATANSIAQPYKPAS